MALHARQPAAGWDAAALEASESARARALLEVLTAARVDIERDVDPGLRAEERALEERTGRARKALVAVLGREHHPAEADAVEHELEGLRAERERLQAKMRASSPRYAALAPARPLSVEEIRSELLDGSTALVEYLVGERQSFVWVVSRSGLRSAVLPGRRLIERAVTAVRERWSDPDAVDDGGERARALSRMVLGPVADALGARTLVVVADGALQQIPFAALPRPGHSQLLIDGHTVVSSPSASVLPALGAAHGGGVAGPELAILADPDLAAADERAPPPCFARWRTPGSGSSSRSSGHDARPTRSPRDSPRTGWSSLSVRTRAGERRWDRRSPGRASFTSPATRSSTCDGRSCRASSSPTGPAPASSVRGSCRSPTSPGCDSPPSWWCSRRAGPRWARRSAARDWWA